MARWTFVRHGESVANRNKTLAGHTDVPLTEQGRREAVGLTEFLADVPFERILVSDLQRAQDTLTLALPNTKLPITVDRGLRERTIGDWEGIPRTLLREQGAMTTLLQWSERPPQGESQQDLAVRVFQTLAHYDQPVDTVVFCHGGVLRVVLGLLDGLHPEVFSRHRYPNCTLQTREVEKDTWKSLWQRSEQAVS